MTRRIIGWRCAYCESIHPTSAVSCVNCGAPQIPETEFLYEDVKSSEIAQVSRKVSKMRAHALQNSLAQYVYAILSAV